MSRARQVRARVLNLVDRASHRADLTLEEWAMWSTLLTFALRQPETLLDAEWKAEIARTEAAYLQAAQGEADAEVAR